MTDITPTNKFKGAPQILAVHPLFADPAAFNLLALVDTNRTPLPAVPQARRRSSSSSGSDSNIIMVDGTAVLPIVGFLSPSGFAGTSVAQLRADVQSLAADTTVDSVLLWLTTPGGSVTQIDELHGDLLALRRQKPVHAFIEALGASAGYWLASAASKISANRTGQVGSLGIVTIVEDHSESYAKQGVKVHIISTGESKGAGIEGTPIPQALLDELGEAVDYLGGIFMAAVMAGRGMTDAQVKPLFSGRVWMAHRAAELGLVDSVGSLTDALATLRHSVGQRQKLRHALA